MVPHPSAPPANLPPSPTNASSVQVVVRLRPLNEKEKKHGTLPVISASTNDKTVTVINKQQTHLKYKFDNVFTAFSTQQDIFEVTLQPVLVDVLNGYESTVFAYGQTGTGKTYTMEGNLNNSSSKGDDDEFGVIPRSAQRIFQTLENSAEYLEYSVSCSFLEIYNEELCDLLASSSTNSTTSSSTTNSSKGGGAAATTKKKPKLDIMEGKNGPFCRYVYFVFVVVVYIFKNSFV